jgi:DNA (cytosine-5)-methyltransferase 1
MTKINNVDNTKTITHLSICSGYEGVGLGLEGIIPGMRTVAYCEREGYAVANLVAKMEAGRLDSAPIWTDITTFPCEEFYGKVDILSAGYPCQPFSVAGKKQGEKDSRHLWPHVARAVELIRPRFCFFENVAGHVTLGLKDVMHDLGRLGYGYTAGLFTASEVGAPHRRERIFILAYSCNGSDGQNPRRDEKASAIQGVNRPSLCGGWITGTSEQLEVTQWIRRRGWDKNGTQILERKESKDQAEGSGQLADSHSEGREGSSSRWPSRPGQPQYEWEPPRVVDNAKTIGRKESRKESGCPPESSGRRKTEPQLGLHPDGNTYRVDQLRLLGNGVVPDQASLAFTTLYNNLINIP